MKKSLFSMLLAATIIITLLTGCSDSEIKDTGDNIIGISLPTDTSARWASDGGIMAEELEALGYEVDLKYAQGDTSEQVKQIEEMIQEGVKCLVVAPVDVDDKSIVKIVRKARKAGIIVVSYDNLLSGTKSVSYYLSYDNNAIGRLIGEYIVNNANLSSSNPQTIEFFMGSSNDNGAKNLYKGMMKVIKPYLKDGSLVCKSGQKKFGAVSTEMWSQKQAQARCEEILKTYYKKEKLNICISAYDGISKGCIDAFGNAGYSFADWPMITGQDAEKRAIDAIATGKQSMTIYKDSSLLAKQCVKMVDDIMKGNKPETNTKVNNGKKKIKSYLLTPVVVDYGNYKEVLTNTEQ